MQKEKHYVNRSGWLRASILGANDGILSTASLLIGVTAATELREPVIIAGVAGVAAGALSMAAGEYVSVSSQSDIEQADLQREKKELINRPVAELKELADFYKKRGLTDKLALEVANQLTEHNALDAHAREELGISDMSQAKPLQAAIASGAAFVAGGSMPLVVAYIASMSAMIYAQYIAATAFLVTLGIAAAKLGGSSVRKAIVRITFWGTLAMGLSAYIGHLFGVSL